MRACDGSCVFPHWSATVRGPRRLLCAALALRCGQKVVRREQYADKITMGNIRKYVPADLAIRKLVRQGSLHGCLL